jgi:hypothetical protein
MKYFCNLRLFVFGWCLVWSATSAIAQQSPKNQIIPGDLANRLRWIQFDIVGGRILASSEQIGTSANNSVSGSGERKERLSIDLNNSAPNLRYELSDPLREINIEVTGGERLLIKDVRDFEGRKSTVELTQVPDQDLTLTIEDELGKRTAGRGPTLWHVLLAEPEITKDSLAPTLELLRPGWKLAAVAHAVEEALFQNARAQRKIDRKRWNEWISSTSSPRFAERERAERNLISAGREILPYLRSLDRSRLDSEQWCRVRNVISSLDDLQGDSVEQTVSLLANDPRAWLTLLNRDELRKRQVALDQLSMLTGEIIAFDPVASEEERKNQWNVLQDAFKN